MSVQMDKMLYLHNFTDEEHLLVCVCVSHQHVPASLRMALKKLKHGTLRVIPAPSLHFLLPFNKISL